MTDNELAIAAVIVGGVLGAMVADRRPRIRTAGIVLAIVAALLGMAYRLVYGH
jgi:hypothetical protein